VTIEDDIIYTDFDKKAKPAAHAAAPSVEPAPTDLFALVDRYKDLLDRKDELAEETKENNKMIEEVRNVLAQTMIDEETPRITRCGFSYTLSEKTKYSKAAGQDDQLMAALRAAGLGDLIRETVNAQSLQGALHELALENDGELPDEFKETVNVYSYYDITKRKETTRRT
jgi:hypothetical protein